MKKNKKLDIVKTKKSLKKHSKLNGALSEIREKIMALGDISQFQDDPDIIEQLCVWVENVNCVCLSGQEKEDIVIKLLIECFSQLNNENDLKRITKQIKHICENNLVKRVSDVALYRSSILNFFCKKFL